MLLMHHVQGRSLDATLFIPLGMGWGLAAGVAYGAVVGAVALGWLHLPFMHEVRERYALRLRPLLPGKLGRWWLSACAGVGEELFFRGALQHWLGIPWTAVLFVAIHGYLDPRDLRLSSYGALMTLAMVGMGALADGMGLLPAMVAHAVVDVILLDQLGRSTPSQDLPDHSD